MQSERLGLTRTPTFKRDRAKDEVGALRQRASISNHVVLQAVMRLCDPKPLGYTDPNAGLGMRHVTGLARLPANCIMSVRALILKNGPYLRHAKPRSGCSVNDRATLAR